MMMHMAELAGRENGTVVPPGDRAIVELTRSGIVTRWSPGAVLLYGYPEEDIVGLGAGVLRPVGKRAEQADVLRRVGRAGRSERYEADMVRKDGTLVTVSVTVAPITSPSGTVAGFRAVSWQARPQAVPDQAEGTIDSERRDARQVQEQTDTQRRDARDAQERIEAAQDSERRDAQDLFDARRDSERREAQKQNEGLRAQLRQIERMGSLGQLAGGVAHDFNNLLSVILSYAGFVSGRLAEAAAAGDDGSWDEARADTAHIQKAVERAAALTRQLLDFASRETIRSVVLDLNEVVTNVKELLRGAIGEHIELSTSLADDLWPIVADVGKLEQVLVNLAVNARDAMPDGGTLAISTSNVGTAADSAGADPEAHQQRHVQLRVSDTGTGMTADVIEHAFDLFFTTKTAGRGTGLGLATVHTILAQADASIKISSQPGMGTTFTIMLPVTDDGAAPGGRPPGPRV
jgi:two-component system, cell cycle sensor histidine kinase and response regulator CckA